MSREESIYYELNPVLVAQVDAFAVAVEELRMARDRIGVLEQELAAAEAELKALRKAGTDATLLSIDFEPEGNENYTLLSFLVAPDLAFRAGTYRIVPA